MKLIEILASAIMNGHVFHLEPGFDERIQGSPSGLIVIEEGAEDDAPTTPLRHGQSIGFFSVFTLKLG